MKPCRPPGISGSRTPSLGLLLLGRVPPLEFLGLWFGLHPGQVLLWVPPPTFPPPRPGGQISAGLEASQALGLSP